MAGHECEFVEQPPKVLQSECPICLLILRDPHQVTCCGYSYCERCIARIKENGQSCPTCKEKGFSSFPDKRLQRALYEFKVRCTYQREGCEWVGELSELDRHVSAPAYDRWKQLWGCPFAELNCLHCGDPFQRRYIMDHQEKHCPKRMFTCEYCREFRAGFEYVVNRHVQDCPSVPVPCPNECGAHPERQHLEKHERNDCPLAFVNCDFRFARCAVRPLRKDLAAHLEESLATHVSLLAKFSHETEDSIAVLRDEFEDQQSDCDRVKENIDSLRDDNRTLKTFIHQQSSVVVILKKQVEDLKREVIDLKRKQGMELLSWDVAQPIDYPLPISAEDLGIVPSQASLAQVDAIPPKIQTMIEVPPHDSVYVVPVTFTFREFEEYKTDNDTWQSPAFYTHPQGYLMCLSVDANGYANGKDTHMSVYISLMRGKYDDSLKWPFIGDITVQLVNQMSENYHHTEVIKFTDTTSPKIAGRVSHEGKGYRKGHSRFIAHSMRVLGYDLPKHRMYLRNNTLQFRIKTVGIH